MPDGRGVGGLTGNRLQDTSSSKKAEAAHTVDSEFRRQYNIQKLYTFYFLCFAYLGLLPVIDLLAGGGFMDFDRMDEAAAAQTGIPWTSSLADMVRLASVEPGLWLLLLGSAAPLLAALTTLMIWPDRAQALRTWRERLWLAGHTGTIRSALMAYGGVFALCLLGLMVTVIIGPQSVASMLERPASIGIWAVLPALLMSALLDQGALLEEGGWRGFASPQLEMRFSPAVAALLVGLGWGFWHLPRDVTTGVIERLGAVEYILAYLPSFLLGTIAVSIIASWGMVRSGGSLWPAILAHGLSNDAFGLAGSVPVVEALTPGHQFTHGVSMMLAAGPALTLDRKVMFSRGNPK
ncbi:CPBP family intramembrane glutamic endopeptidase [Maricaulis sp.]|uniref:CPBP family intramembrane glutamic endopeptidase n=1 Tax=Maricaulis sp. TaxID=1486257 RepID=UPI003A935613